MRGWTFAGTWSSADIITLVVGSKATTVTAGSTTIATIIDNVVSAWNALSATDWPEFAEQTASRSGSDLRLTADTAGKPFAATLSTNSASGTLDGAASSAGVAVTASSGPYDWSTARNWSGAAVPVNSDDVIIDHPEYPIKYGLDQSAVTLTSLTITAAFADTGQIGLPEVNEDGAAYFEYRDTYLKVSATTTRIGDGEGSGSGRIKLNYGSVQNLTHVRRTATGLDTDVPAVLLRGTHASNVFNVEGESEVGVALFGGETSTVATLRVQDGASVRCGSGVTLGTIVVNNGTLEANSAVGTSLTITGGSATLNGTGAVAQLTVLGASVVYNTSGTLGGNTVVGDGGVIDFSQDPQAKTVTNPIDAFNSPTPVIDPFKVVGTLVVDFNQSASVLPWGSNVRLSRGTPA